MEWDGFPGKGIGPGIRLLQSVALLMGMDGGKRGEEGKGEEREGVGSGDPPLLDLPAPF